MNDWRPYVLGLMYGLILVAAALLSSGLLAQEAQVIEPGDVVEGTLAQEPNTVRYQFEGNLGDQINVSLTSRDFDPLLQVESTEGEVIAENDDTGGSLNAGIEGFALPADGQYTLVVTSSDGTGSGDFELNLQLTPLMILEYDDVVEGEITGSSRSMRYRFDGTAGDVISIHMTSEAFDAFLTLSSLEFELISDDDSGGGYNAMIPGFVLPQTASYIITARPLNEFSTGHFTLALAEAERQPLAYNSSISGEVNGDPAFYVFEGSNGDIVDIQIKGDDELDLMLNLRSPEGYPAGMDDDSGAGYLPELLNLTLEQDGEYTLAVQPLTTDIHGEFTLTLTAREPETTAFGKTFTADFSYKNQRRVYSLEAENAETVRITATPDTGDTVSLIVSVIQNGQTITTFSGLPSEETLILETPVEAGLFRVVVADYSLIRREVNVMIENVADSGEG